MVYFIQGKQTGLIKIGKTANLTKRWSALQIGSPDPLVLLATIPDASDDTPYHARFDASRVHGEWFQPSPQLIAFIESLPKNPDVGERDIRTRHVSPHPVQPLPKTTEAEERAEFAAEVLHSVSFSKPGSSTRLSYMRLYARLRGWKSWRDATAGRRWQHAEPMPLKMENPNVVN